MSDYDMNEMAKQELLKLDVQPAIDLHMNRLHLFYIISQLQLALRHPANIGGTADVVREWANEIRRKIAEPGTALDAIIQMGWNPDNDHAWIGRSDKAPMDDDGTQFILMCACQVPDCQCIVEVNGFFEQCSECTAGLHRLPIKGEEETR